MHLPATIIENSTQIGVGADGSPLHRWTEENGSRVFEERYVYFTSTSGHRVGLVNVFEIPEGDEEVSDPQEREDAERRAEDWPPVRGQDY